MEIKFQPMGATQTNCYIVTIDNKEFIIDPGMNALPWIKENSKNPVAILNTHGHFDHVWSNAAVKREFNIPLYIQKDDAFMLSKCPLGQNVPES
ncbi:MAG: MBL fold metallo-hydrolase, partial [Sulfurovum sp.]